MYAKTIQTLPLLLFIARGLCQPHASNPRKENTNLLKHLANSVRQPTQVNSNFKNSRELSTNCHFIKYDGFTLYGHNDETLDDVSLAECQDLCRYQIAAECNAIDYNQQDRLCYLSSATHLSHPDAFGQHWAADYYYKQCEQETDVDTCPPGYFSCKDNGVCLDTSLLCDGEANCFDGSDEENCDSPVDSIDSAADESSNPLVSESTVECGLGFHCPNTELCISHTYKCDHDRDCPAGEDELNCRYKPCDPDTQFTCDQSRKCLPAKWRCDGYNDCSDNSDEISCQ